MDLKVGTKKIEAAARNLKSLASFEAIFFKKLSRCNELKVEANHARYLANCSFDNNKNIVEVNFETEMMKLDHEIEVKKEETKQKFAEFQETIELPAKLEVFKLAQISRKKCDTIKSVTRTEEFKIKTLVEANIELKTSEILVETRGSRKVAEALQSYYKALIWDQMSAFILQIISKSFNIDPLFRMRLERPITIKVCPTVIDETQPGTRAIVAVKS